MATTSNPTPNIPLVTGWSDGEDAWGGPMNLNLRVIDALMNLVLKSITIFAPPGSPTAGDRYYIPSTSTPTGIWSGQAGKIAYWTGTDWVFIPPRSLWVATVQSPATRFVYFDGTDFIDQPGPGSLAALTARVTDLEAWKTTVDTQFNDLDTVIDAINAAATALNTRVTNVESALATIKQMEPITANTNFSILAAMVGKYIIMIGSTTQTITIPDSLSATIPVGSSLIIRHRNPLGRVKFEAMPGVTLNLPFGGGAETAGGGATVGLYKAAANIWELSGQVKYQDALAADERMVVAPNSSGSSVSMGNGLRRLIFLPLADVTSISIAMPAAPYDGQIVNLVTRRAMSGVTHTATSPATIIAPITSLVAGERRAYQYYDPDKLWLPY